MGFVNEVVSDDDIDRYGLPFRKGSGRYWTRDAERDYYLWGGLSGNPATGEDTLGIFYLFLNGTTYRAGLVPGSGSVSYVEDPYIVKWDSVKYLNPSVCDGNAEAVLLQVLKEALTVYGDDGRNNKYAKNVSVRFQF